MALADTSGVISGVEPGDELAWKSNEADREDAIDIARGIEFCFSRSGADSSGVLQHPLLTTDQPHTRKSKVGELQMTCLVDKEVIRL